MNEKYNEDMCCQREIVTKERLYKRLNNDIEDCEMTIMRAEARLNALRATKRNLDEYFEDLNVAESEVVNERY